MLFSLLIPALLRVIHSEEALLEAEFGRHHYGRVDLELRAGQKELALELFASGKVTRILEWPVVRQEDLDGVKVFLGDIGWLLVRGSGTEPMLRVYSETTSPEATRRVLDHVVKMVRAL